MIHYLGVKNFIFHNLLFEKIRLSKISYFMAFIICLSVFHENAKTINACIYNII